MISEGEAVKVRAHDAAQTVGWMRAWDSGILDIPVRTVEGGPEALTPARVDGPGAGPAPVAAFGEACVWSGRALFVSAGGR